MKRCPKCNRTFPDENQKFCTVDGGLLIATPAFDPNATIRATSADLGIRATDVQGDNAATNREFPDLNATIAASSVAPTAVFPLNTAQTGAATPVDLPPQASAPFSVPIAQPQKKRSKLPWILGGLVLLLVFGASSVAGVFFLVIKPRLKEFRDRALVSQSRPATHEDADKNASPENTDKSETKSETKPETETKADTFVPPADTVKFTNSKANLEGKLAEHYLDFSFYYPQSWQTDPKAGIPGASNFVKVERMLPPDFTQENFAVGWYTSKGTFASDLSTFPELVQILSSNLAKSFPEYRKISEGPTKVNLFDGYEFRFMSLSKGTEKGDIQLWGRVIFLPTDVQGETTGATLIMLSTSLAPELSGVQDVGEKGEMPVIIESFRFGRNK